VAATTVREHRLAAGYAIFIPSSLTLGLLLAAHNPAFLAAGFGAALACAGLARRHVQHWHAAEGRSIEGWVREFGCLQPQFLAFHARRGRLPVVPMLVLQLVPILLLTGNWVTLALGVLLAL
jgi:hypothetical protein